jgi:hypothetical protein
LDCIERRLSAVTRSAAPLNTINGDLVLIFSPRSRDSRNCRGFDVFLGDIRIEKVVGLFEAFVCSPKKSQLAFSQL